jgi:hypothetical protein
MAGAVRADIKLHRINHHSCFELTKSLGIAYVLRVEIVAT